MSAPLGRRVAAEAIGTGLLVVAVVVGSAIQATELSRDVGVQLLANSLATVFGLGVLILLLGPVSGAHFNPAVTLAAWFTGRRTPGGLALRDVAAYVAAQITGAVGGAVLADAMFAEPLVRFSTHDRSAGHLLCARCRGGLRGEGHGTRPGHRRNALIRPHETDARARRPSPVTAERLSIRQRAAGGVAPPVVSPAWAATGPVTAGRVVRRAPDSALFPPSAKRGPRAAATVPCRASGGRPGAGRVRRRSPPGGPPRGG